MTGRNVHIAGMLIHAKPEALESVLRTVRSLHAADIHETGMVGKLAVVLECAYEREIASCIEQVQAIPGVLSVSMTSHYIEDAAELAAEMPQ